MTPATSALPLLWADWTGLPAHVRACTSLRYGGVSLGAYGDVHGEHGLNLGAHVGDTTAAVLTNRAILNQYLPAPATFLSQVHGNIVVCAENLADGVEADALIATQSGIVCAVLTADCLPVLFSDSQAKVVAAAHAGWRGLADGVLHNTVAAMHARGAQEITAWLGPAISAQQFEVGQDVFDAFAIQLGNVAHCFVEKAATSDGEKKYLADIYQLAREILQSLGVKQVFGGQHCTVSEQEQFYSYRRDKVTGRMASMIWLEA